MWTFGPQTFANMTEVKSALQASTLPSQAKSSLHSIANKFTTDTGPAITLTGNGEDGVNATVSAALA